MKHAKSIALLSTPAACLTYVALTVRLPTYGLAAGDIDTNAFLDTLSRQGPISALLGVFAIIALYMHKASVTFDKFSKRVLAVVSAILSLTIVFSGKTESQSSDSISFPWYTVGDPAWSSKRYVAFLVFQFFFISLFLYKLLIFAVQLVLKQDTINRRSKLLSSILTINVGNKKNILLSTLLVFAFWLPIAIINGPAIIGVDSMVQLIQMRGFRAWDPMTMEWLDGYNLTDHHPFFDSFIYGAFDRIGLFFGHEIVGLQLLIILQLLVGSFSLVLSLAWVNTRAEIPEKVFICLFALILLVPCFSMYMTIILKDTTWVPFFLIWAVLFAETVFRLSKKQDISTKLIATLILFAVIAGLTKKTSMYVTTPSTAILLFFFSHRIKILLSALIPPLITLIMIPSLLFPVLHIAPGGPQEPLSVPIQQITKVLIDHQNELSASDLQTISKVLKIDKAKKNYDPLITDNAKHYGYKTTSTSKDRVNFLMLWAKLFFKYPISYFSSVTFLKDAFLVGPTYYYTSSVRCGWYEAGGYAILPEYKECTPSTLQSKIALPLVNLLNRIPPFSFLGSESLYTAWIPCLSVGACITRKKWKNLIYFTPVLFLELTMLILPAHQIRYSLGLLFTFALTIAVPFIGSPKDANKTIM